MRYLMFFVAFLVVFAPRLASAQNYGPYEFSNLDPRWNTDFPPLFSKVAYRFHGNANYGSPPWTTLQWHTNQNNDMNSYIITVINDYLSESYWPDWISMSTTETTAVNADVILNTASCPGNPNLAACTVYKEWAYNQTAFIYTVSEFEIRVKFFYGFNEQGKHFSIAHELGHVLSMGEQYIETPTGIQCGGGNTIMDAYGCNTLSGPTQTDAVRLWRFFEACDGISIWCGYIDYQNNSITLNGTTVHTGWSNRNWMMRYWYFYYDKSESQYGPWTRFHTQIHTPNSGFWEDAIPQTYGFYKAFPSYNVGPQTYYDWVRVCSRPFITWGVWGTETCSEQAVFVP